MFSFHCVFNTTVDHVSSFTFKHQRSESLAIFTTTKKSSSFRRKELYDKFCPNTMTTQGCAVDKKERKKN